MLIKRQIGSKVHDIKIHHRQSIMLQIKLSFFLEAMSRLELHF